MGIIFRQIAIFLLFSVTAIRGQGIIINEIMSNNETTILDEDGESSDWIELFNNTEEAIILSGYSLSDDIEDQSKWDFPNVQINSKSYLLIFASSKDRKNGELHTNFKISSSGEDIFLTKNAVIIDQLFAPEIMEDVSYGRLPDAATDIYKLSNPSPGLTNNANDQLSFSYAQGFYTAPFYQTVNSLLEYEIHYTLDGGIPTAGSPILSDSILISDRTSQDNLLTEIPTTDPNYVGSTKMWKSPLYGVDKANTLRFASFADGVRTSKVYSHSYFVNEDGADNYEMPVISLITPAENFFDEQIGIYVPGASYDPNISESGNYFLSGRESERDVHITYFDDNGNIGFSQDAGVRIHGGSTRKFAQKSLKMYARKDYGAEIFHYPLLPQKSFDKYENFILRTTMGAKNGNSIIKDDVAHDIVQHMDIGHQDYRPVVVFLNGEYWGIHSIRDRLEEKYIEYTYGVDRESVEINNIWGNVDYNNMLSFISDNDLSLLENYETVGDMMEIDHYIDYQIAEMYLNNFDWPVNNIKGWRSDELTGKWRWLFFDLDFSFGDPSYNMFEHCTNEDPDIDWPNPPRATILFRGLLENESFKLKFIDRYIEMLNDEFRSDITLSRLQHVKSLYEPEVNRHIQRWTFPSSESTWSADIATDMEYFLEDRACHIADQLKDFFNLDTINYVCDTTEVPRVDTPPYLSIYPNPTIDNLVNISLDQMHDEVKYSAKVYNSVGALIVNEVLINDTNTIDLGDEVGIKFIVIFGDGEIIRSEKIVRL